MFMQSPVLLSGVVHGSDSGGRGESVGVGSGHAGKVDLGACRNVNFLEGGVFRYGSGVYPATALRCGAAKLFQRTIKE